MTIGFIFVDLMKYPGIHWVNFIHLFIVHWER